MATARVAPAVVTLVVALSVAGCGPKAPTRISGEPAPLTVPASASPSSRPPATSEGPASPVVPRSYTPFRFTGAGVTVSVPVPTGWRRSGTASRIDFRDPTDQILLRLEVQPRGTGTARQGWEDADASARKTFQGYQLLSLTDVPGVGDSAADWRFSFLRDGVRRRVVDRGILSGGAALAVYYSAPESHYERLEPVWNAAVTGLSIT